jgi:hypothetical protein
MRFSKVFSIDKRLMQDKKNKQEVYGLLFRVYCSLSGISVYLLFIVSYLLLGWPLFIVYCSLSGFFRAIRGFRVILIYDL